jgi:hypothetical protein
LPIQTVDGRNVATSNRSVFCAPAVQCGWIQSLSKTHSPAPPIAMLKIRMWTGNIYSVTHALVLSASKLISTLQSGVRGINTINVQKHLPIFTGNISSVNSRHSHCADAQKSLCVRYAKARNHPTWHFPQLSCQFKYMNRSL